MKMKIILAIIAGLLSGETLAAESMPGIRSSGLSEFPASSLQLQVSGMGMEAVERGKNARFKPSSSDRGYGTESSPTYNRMPVNLHQMKVLKIH
jgi:hypothetical protein